jgi:uncharacterized repeat protein (TIGR01451 family)
MRPFRSPVPASAILMIAALASSLVTIGAGAAPVGAVGQCGPLGALCPPANGPLILIAKTASPTSLPTGGGPVTYTYTVSNGGTVPLTSVSVGDDKCAPVSYVSGDVNGNLALDLTETWLFTCTATITATTVNTATAQGVDPSGLGTSATAQATVTVQECSPTAAGPNCPPPPCPAGTPNCPPPPCTPSATNPNCQPVPARLCITKFNDLNGDGGRQATEPVMGGLTFTISPPVPPVSQKTPAGTGQVCWDVPPGTYTVTESGPPAGWVATTPKAAPSTSQTVTLTAGASKNLRFGDHRFLIDHQACYAVTPTTIGTAANATPFTNITLRDQFATYTASAVARQSVCNPATKIHGNTTTRARNLLAHLVCYTPSRLPAVPAAGNTVMTIDQFGTDLLRVLRPVALCLPSGKSLTDQFPKVPTTLDHYLCYSVKDLTPRQYPPVGLIDEFGRQSVEIVAPVALCTPVQKTYGGTTTRIRDVVDHFVCYSIAGQNQPRSVWISNQFEQIRLQAGQPMQLCVPALKRIQRPPATSG